jgi:uncharacterized protein (DUF1015 family)
MRIRPFRAVYPNLDIINSADTFFGRVKYEYPDYKKEGFFNKIDEKAIYIYRLSKPDRNYTGLIACSDINDYLEGKIKKHENTLRPKERQQMQLMIRRNAIVKPVLLTYPGITEITNLLNSYIEKNRFVFETEFEKENQRHTFWKVNEQPLIQKIQQLFIEKVPITYIADGHHRCSSTALMHQMMKGNKNGEFYNFILSAFFPTEELEIHDFNRIVERQSSLTTFMARLSQVFEIEIMEEPAKPSRKFEIVLFINHEWFKLSWKESVLENYKNQKVVLDASLLDELVLQNIMGIDDIRSSTRINYVEGPKGLKELKSRTIKNDNNVGFCLFPIALNDILTVADMGATMPPKSTFFEPRIKNGLIVQEFEKP